MVRSKTRKVNKTKAYADANVSKLEQRKVKRMDAHPASAQAPDHLMDRASGRKDEYRTISEKAAHRARAADRLNKCVLVNLTPILTLFPHLILPKPSDPLTFPIPFPSPARYAD